MRDEQRQLDPDLESAFARIVNLQAEVERLKAEREELRMELAMLRWEAQRRERSDSGR